MLVLVVPDLKLLVCVEDKERAQEVVAGIHKRGLERMGVPGTEQTQEQKPVPIGQYL